jgi:uncharacterized protein
MNKQILKVLVGSRAHGLETPESDYDYRGVMVMPTSEFLSLKHKDNEGNVSWIEGQEDQSIYELKHFLNLATHSNPSILEVFVSPVIEATYEGYQLRNLFPFVWSSNDVFNAFTGYSGNQQKKMLTNKDQRWNKYGVAYARVLLLAEEILSKGTMTVQLEEGVNKRILLGIKNKEYSTGFIIDWCEKLKANVETAYKANPDKKTDYDKINHFLLDTRKDNW